MEKKKVIVLGGYGEMGFSICRQILQKGPRELMVTSLRREEASSEVGKLRLETSSTSLLTLVRTHSSWP